MKRWYKILMAVSIALATSGIALTLTADAARHEPRNDRAGADFRFCHRDDRLRACAARGARGNGGMRLRRSIRRIMRVRFKTSPQTTRRAKACFS